MHKDNGLNMQTEIRREQIIELTFEGFWRADLRFRLFTSNE